MKFWDTSAIVPLIVQEEHSKSARALFEKDSRMMMWWGTEIELVSAIARLHRLGAITSDQQHVLVQWVEEKVNAAYLVEPVGTVLSHARRVLLTHPLRSGDAFQLAAAITGAEMESQKLQFVSFDRDLREAAFKEGFRVEPAEIIP